MRASQHFKDKESAIRQRSNDDNENARFTLKRRKASQVSKTAEQPSPQKHSRGLLEKTKRESCMDDEEIEEELSLSWKNPIVFLQEDIVQNISKFLIATTAGTTVKDFSVEEVDEQHPNLGTSNSCQTKTNRQEPSLESVIYLVKFLETTKSTILSDEKRHIDKNDVQTDTTITKEDIATLLLPWSVSRLYRLSETYQNQNSGPESNKIVNRARRYSLWRTLSACLTALMSSSPRIGKTTLLYSCDLTNSITTSSELTLSNAFSQGALNRLIPYAVVYSFEHGYSNDKHNNEATMLLFQEQQMYVSQCFLHLMRRFRPSLDDLCYSLLSQMDELVSPFLFCPGNVLASVIDNISSDATENHVTESYPTGRCNNKSNFTITIPKHQVCVINSILGLIHSSLSNANPKRSFSTLCSSEVLPRLGRLAMVDYFQEKEYDDETEDCGGLPRSIVEKILLDGLFHPEHHMGGYCALEELRRLPSFSEVTPEISDENVGMKEEIEQESKISRERAKSCYSAGLFTSIRDLLSLRTLKNFDEIEHRHGADSQKNAEATAYLLPMIVQCFFQRMCNNSVSFVTKEECTNGKRSRSTTEANANLQFRFWCSSIFPGLELLFARYGSCEVLDLRLLEMISETTTMVMESDVYSPTYSDPDEIHFSFLEFVSRGLLRCIEIDSKTEKTLPHTYDLRMISFINSLTNLFRLNHRLLHERLSTVISFACICLNRSARKSLLNVLASLLLSTVIKAYRELRQIRHFLVSSKVALNIMKESHHKLDAMFTLLSCQKVMKSLELAYQCCPSGQLNEIWNIFDSWIDTSLPGFNDVTKTQNLELIFSIRMFIVFIRSIRTDKQNSPELRSLCENSMTSSAHKLLEKAINKSNVSIDLNHHLTSRDVAIIQQSFDLCSWLVDLHSRSSFWIDNINIDRPESVFLLTQKLDDETLNVLSYLHQIVEKTVASENFQQWKKGWLSRYWQEAKSIPQQVDKVLGMGIHLPLSISLQRLALNRIQQLHYMIYHVKSLEEDGGIFDMKKENDHSSIVLRNEANTLVDFSLYLTCCQTSTSSATSADETPSLFPFESLWSIITQSLSIWSLYGDSLHHEVFMIWFFSSLCQNTVFNVVPKDMLLHEQNIVLTLVRDASFYDVNEIMRFFLPVGIRFALSQGLRIISQLYFDLNETDLITSQEMKVTPSCLNFFQGINCNSEATLTNSMKHGIGVVATTVSYLASVPLDLTLGTENLCLVDKIVGLDILISMLWEKLQTTSENMSDTFLRILCCSRYIMANILSKTILTNSESEAILLDSIAEHLFTSNTIFISNDYYLSATGSAASEILTLFIDYNAKDHKLLPAYFTRLKKIVSTCNIKSLDTFTAQTCIMRCVIRRLNTLDRQHKLPKMKANPTEEYDICVELVMLTHEHWWNNLVSMISNAKGGVEHFRVAATAVLLASEILLFLMNNWRSAPESKSTALLNATKKNVQSMFHLVSVSKKESNNFNLNAAIHYFFASMAAVPKIFLQCVPSTIVIEKVLDAMKLDFFEGKDNSLLDTTLCSIIRSSKVEDIEFLLSSLDKRLETMPNYPAFTAKVYHLLINCVSQEQIKFLSCRLKSFLLTSMNLLRAGNSAQSSQRVSDFTMFTKFITTVITKKDLIVLQGRDIAMICCEMSPFLEVDAIKKSMVEEIAIFKCCCSVLSSLVANYPKQLYGCSSPFFSFLMALLIHLIKSNIKEGLSQKAIEYARQVLYCLLEHCIR